MLSRASSGADRLRDALTLGIAIPFVLAFAGLLWPLALWLVIAALVAARVLVRYVSPTTSAGSTPDDRIGQTLPIVAAIAAAWPALVRPLLQGDSLGYYLPNAASWVQAHSVWVTTTNFWFYPGGSELFASGLLAAAGTLAVGFAGLGALLLLGLRLQAWGVELGVHPWVAGAIAAFALSSFTFAEQAGSLENDVWLAAFFLESLWLMRASLAGAFGRATAVTALIKPVGPLYAGLALVLALPPWRIALLAVAPIAFWAARDAILWDGAVIAPASVYYVGWFATTIVAHGSAGLLSVWEALRAEGAATIALFAAGLCSIALARDARLRLAAAVSLVIFAFHPFGFAHPQPQFGAENPLHLAAPFLALGALFLHEIGRRAPVPAGVLAVALAAYGLARTVGIFANDATTHGTWLIVAIVAIVLLLPWDGVRRRLVPATLSGLCAYAVVLAGSHPLDYYEDWLGRGAGHSRFFHWLAATQPPAIVGYGLRIGAIAAVSPSTRVVDTYVRNPCREAHTLGALLVVSGDILVNVRTGYEPRRAFAERCGAIVFDDGTTIVVNPHSGWPG